MARKRENMTPLEVEARSYAFRKMLKERLGCTCANCGSEDDIEYHHIVPLALGGTNALTNLIPLCYKCHKAAHHGRHITSFADHSHSDDGRPPKCNDETAFRALDLLADGQIGIRKCKQMMNLAARTEPVMTSQYKKWIKLRGYQSVRNILDTRITNKGCGVISDGDYIGDVTYPDGTKGEIVFKDTGLNDDVMYTPRYSREEITFREMKERGSCSSRASIVSMDQKKRSIDVPDWFREYRKSLKAASAI